MIAAERQQKIIEILLSRDFIALPQLAEVLGVSVMTIRRDVAELSSRGKILAVRGGVKSISPSTKTLSGIARRPSLLRGALEYVNDCQTIFLDGGELCRELAQYIHWRDDMTVVTNDFQIAHDIIEHACARLYFIGGELRRSDNTFHRREACDAISKLNFELLFLSPCSWNERGVWHNEEHRQVWYKTLINASGKRILLAKSNAYSQSGLFNLYPIEKADVILTDHVEFTELAGGRFTPSKLRLLR